MKTLTQYHFKILLLFHNYLKNDIILSDLIKKLRDIEFEIFDNLNDNETTNKSLWFRFSKDDTLATTIKNIETDLSLPINHINHIYMVEIMEYSIDNVSLQVFYS